MLSFISLVIVALILLSLGYGVRKMATKENPLLWIATPANRFALIVTNDKKGTEDVDDSGGNITNALHSVPGKWLDKSDPNPMKWEFRDFDSQHEIDPEHTGFLYWALGVQGMGVFRTPKLILDKRLRYTRKEGETETHTVAKDKRRHFFHYSGEQTVSIKDSDTKDGLGIDVEIDFILERVQPVKAMLRLADAASFLASKIEETVNLTTAKYDAEDYFRGDDVAKNKKEIADEVEKKTGDFKDQLLEELGIEIKAVNLRSAGAKPEHRALIELETKAELEGKGKVAEARRDKEAKILASEAEAFHVANVIKPAAENELTVRVREAEAYEKNTTVTTFVRGNGAGILVGNNTK